MGQRDMVVEQKNKTEGKIMEKMCKIDFDMSFAVDCEWKVDLSCNHLGRLFVEEFIC